jgi:hypothetical protein
MSRPPSFSPGLVCGARIVVRAFQWAETWRPWGRPEWHSPIVFRIRLRNTFGLEVAGFAVAILIINMAIPFLKPA